MLILMMLNLMTKTLPFKSKRRKEQVFSGTHIIIGKMGNFEPYLFSAAKAALDMQMSVSQSVSQSVCNAYLFVRFTCIFYTSKSD